MQPAAVSLLIVATASALAPPRLFFDLKTNAAALGRIEVELAAFDSLPRLVENLRLIAANERAPRCSFDGSRFRHAPQGPQYKWSHEFEGAGNRPAIEPSLLKADAAPSCRHDVFGGSYYGYRWNDADDVLLTTPRVGPGAHKARFSFVRVKSSPPAWQERLLVNSYVLGVCAPGADDVLQRLCELPADAEPRIERAGLLDVADDCLVPAPEDARRRRPTSDAVAATSNTQVDIEEDCLWDADQEAEWRERRFLQVGNCVERQRGPRRSMVPAQVEKEGFRDPARGNSGTVR